VGQARELVGVKQLWGREEWILLSSQASHLRWEWQRHPPSPELREAKHRGVLRRRLPAFALDGRVDGLVAIEKFVNH
jgi:hypothetical protein